MVVSLLLGSHAQGMEVTVTQEESPVTSATLSRWDSSKTHNILTFLNGLPQELKWYILSLFLEMELGCNFEYSKKISLENWPNQGFSSDETNGIIYCKNRVFSLDLTSVRASLYSYIARLQDATRGQQLLILNHLDKVSSVAFSPEGATVLTASYGKTADNTACLWDVATGQQLHKLKGHKSTIYSVAYSPDGTTVLTGSWDGTARLWDVKRGQQLHILQGHTGFVYSVAFSPNGSIVITGSLDRTACLWDVKTGQLLEILKGPEGIYSVAFSSDGTTVLTGSLDKTACLWDVKTGKKLQVFTGHTNVVTSVAFSPDGTTVLTGSSDRTARLWDIKSGLQLKVLEGHINAIYSVAFSSDRTTIFIESIDDTIRIWKRAGRQSDFLKLRQESAKELLMRKFFPDLSGKSERVSPITNQEPPVLGFTEAINLDDDSQKECSIQ
ncbi:WD40 repeat domain-containing protein [Candidatus Dependentiae bacterium]|nr:WD40 repeat domain-containing protein [Candidatus Dependentiae bacterium]